MEQEKEKEEEAVSSSIKDLADYYTDEKQETIKSLQGSAEHVRQEYPANAVRTADYVKAVLGFFVVTAAGFGWMLLMLLIVSFVTLSYLHFNIGKMLVASGIFAAVVAVIYVVFTIKKFSKK